MLDTHRKLVTIFGGSGFVGTQIVQELARKGYRIRVAVRRPDLAGHVKTLGLVGQIQPIQANVRNMPSVERAVAGADMVINLTGILFEAGRQRFRAVHTMGAANVAEAAAAAGAKSLVHMSAIGADPDSDSAYSRSKGLGEAEVLKAFPSAVIIRPSLIFGPGDGLFNRFGAMSTVLPFLPLIGGNSMFQPVYVSDVAKAFAMAADGQVKPGQVYELGGPERESMREILTRLNHYTGRKRLLMPLPTGLARFMGGILQLLPSPMLTTDQVIQLQSDNVVSEEAERQKRTFVAFGISPTTMEAIVPGYVWQYRKHGQFANVPS